jgi:hypothetical protein
MLLYHSDFKLLKRQWKDLFSEENLFLAIVSEIVVVFSDKWTREPGHLVEIGFKAGKVQVVIIFIQLVFILLLILNILGRFYLFNKILLLVSNFIWFLL